MKNNMSGETWTWNSEKGSNVRCGRCGKEINGSDKKIIVATIEVIESKSVKGAKKNRITYHFQYVHECRECDVINYDEVEK